MPCNIPTNKEKECRVRLKWLENRYPTVKSYCQYLDTHRKYWSPWNRTWEKGFGIQSTQGIEGLHASFKVGLDGQSIRANLVPQHLHDCYAKRLDKSVKSYSINSTTYEEHVVLNESMKSLSSIATNAVGGPSIANLIEKYLNKAGKGTTHHIYGMLYHTFGITYHILV